MLDSRGELVLEKSLIIKLLVLSALIFWLTLEKLTKNLLDRILSSKI